MRLYEYEGKRIFARYGLPVPPGVVIDSNSYQQLDKVTYPVVIKAQAFVGARAKSGFVQFASNRDEARERISSILGKMHGGHSIERVLVEQRIKIKRELYLSVIVDRLQHRFLVMTSRHGGIDIEEVARSKPEELLKFYLNTGADMHAFMARTIASGLGLNGALLNAGAGVILGLYRLFLGYDCKVAEINPLVVTEGDRLFALDAKVDLDEDAMFRHPDLKEMGITARHEVGELSERERIAKKAGIPYVDLDGDIGVFPGGAGFGIAAIDLIQHYGGKPANFMDSGGAPTQEKLRAMLGLLLDNPRVKAIFGARFGGISRCDDWAKAVVQYVIEKKPVKPMVMRMAGNMEEQGRKIIEQAKSEHPELFQKITVYAYDMPIEEVIKETIRAAKAEK
ncbi:MAG: acetate--CoA ligase family protein [candidate division WOR-3 bacterium]|nr:acetate--CoA ligase family protein [candidate division WOR-3 bacterium]